jgi:ELWxxDGT repeat protein
MVKLWHMKKSILFLIGLIPAVTFSQPFRMLKNLDSTLSDSSFDNQPQTRSGGNNIFFFSAKTSAMGIELFKSFVDNPGSSLVKDIYPGPQSSYPGYEIVVNEVLYFSAIDSLHGRELWKSDGTASGTMMIKDIYPNQKGSDPGGLILLNGVIYFVADDSTHGRELWKTDGTEAGTVMVKDINPGSPWSGPGTLVAHGNYFYFAANDLVHGLEPWRSDGTEAGTIMLKDMSPGPAHTTVYEFEGVGNMVFFNTRRDVFGNDIWKSDGTEAGTVVVKNFPFPSSSPLQLTAVNGILFFSASNNQGSELWKSDGTAAGTVMVKDIRAGDASSYPSHFIGLNNKLYFTADDGIHGNELWRSDGTAAGTVLVFDIWPGIPDAQFGRLAICGNNIWFVANDGIHGQEIWKSDGTTQGTFFVQDINPGPGGSYAASYQSPITQAGDKIFLVAEAPSLGLTGKIWVNIVNQSTVPVTIVNLKGILQKESVDIFWQSQNEDNVKGFQVQRSVDGVSFYNIGFVNATGNAVTNGYHYSDFGFTQASAKILYYRLKIFDNDNKSYYSKTVPIVIDKNVVSIMGWPNPTQTEFHLELILPERDNLSARVYNMQGQLVQQRQFELGAGFNTRTLSVQSLTSGTYIIVIQGNKINWSAKIVKQ